MDIGLGPISGASDAGQRPPGMALTLCDADIMRPVFIAAPPNHARPLHKIPHEIFDLLHRGLLLLLQLHLITSSSVDNQQAVNSRSTPKNYPGGSRHPPNLT